MSIDGIDLTGLHWTECEKVFSRLKGKAFALRFLSPPVRAVSLRFVTFSPDGDEAVEALSLIHI